MLLMVKQLFIIQLQDESQDDKAAVYEFCAGAFDMCRQLALAYRKSLGK